VSCTGGKAYVHEVLVQKPEGKKLLGIRRYNKRLILKWIKKNVVGGCKQGQLVQDRDQWWILVKLK
jgi:hypothetical protein